jgi:Spy/CpxP family protein refolding chaperone
MSRFVAIAAAVALVVSGIMIGALSTYLVLDRPRFHEGLRPPPPTGPPPPRPFTREMESRLDLTEAQRDQIETILQKGREQSDAIRRELRPRLESQLESTRASIAAVLTPDQRAKFEELVKQDRRRAERFFLEGPPGPPPGDGPPR